MIKSFTHLLAGKYLNDSGLVKKNRVIFLKSRHDLAECFKSAGESMSSISKEAYKATEFIFFEGDIESHFYIIESGEVLIFTKDKTGQKVEIARLNAGETFGEFALIDKGARSASAQAITDCRMMKISSEGYEMMLNDLPTWASSMLTSFSSRLKQMNQALKESKSQKK